MAVTEVPRVPRADVAPDAPAGRGFRPPSRRRARIAAGVAIAAVAVAGNVAIYTALDDRIEVVQIVNNISAGDLIEDTDLRIVEVDLDPTVQVVRSADIGLVSGRYARTYLVSGSLVTPQLVQAGPLVAPGFSAVALEIRPTLIPAGLRERSQVEIVIPGEDGQAPVVVNGRVAAVGDIESTSGVIGITIEVAADLAATVVEADDLGIVLLDPAGRADPALATAEP